MNENSIHIPEKRAVEEIVSLFAMIMPVVEGYLTSQGEVSINSKRLLQAVESYLDSMTEMPNQGPAQNHIEAIYKKYLALGVL